VLGFNPPLLHCAHYYYYTQTSARGAWLRQKSCQGF
jgi:hypothetical protein